MIFLKSFGFEVLHGYQCFKGCVDADSKEDAIKMIENGEWDEIIDEYNTEGCTIGYEVTDIWEI